MKRMPMGGNFNMNNLMKQAQKMQQDMAKKQAELEEMVFTASSGGGAVTATVQHKQSDDTYTNEMNKLTGGMAGIL